MKPIIYLTLLAIIVFLTGCMTYSHNKLGDADQLLIIAASKSDKPSINLRVTAERQFNKKPQVLHPAVMAKWEESVVKHYKESELFSAVKTGRNISDIYADVVIVNNEEGNLFLAFLSGFTLMVLPAKGDNIITIETTFKDAAGNIKGKVIKTEKVTTWIQLLLIFGMPFSVSTDDVFGQIIKHTLAEAEVAGYLRE